METRRLILAIALSILILIGWQLLFVKKAPQAVSPAGKIAQSAAAPTAARPAEQAPQPKPGPENPPENQPNNLIINKIEASEDLSIAVRTSLFEATWSNKGAVLTSWKLRNHLDAKKEPLDLVAPASRETGVFPFSLLEEAPDADLAAIASSQVNSARYQANSSAIDLADGETAELKFEYSDGRSLEVEKTFKFTGGRYDFDVTVRVRRNGQPVDAQVLWGPGIGDSSDAAAKESSSRRRTGLKGGGASVLASGKLYRIDGIPARYKPEESAFNFATWAAYDDNYFAALFLPGGQNGTVSFLMKPAGPSAFFLLSIANPQKAYVGPKEYDTLTAFGYGTKKLVRFGFFGFFAELLFYAIKYIQKIVPNWGWAIVVLTIIIKILFFPLSYSQTKSMQKMAELQPKIKSLQAKFKNAKRDIDQRRQLNEEMMKLYKQHGVNPAGGCLPMLIQIPFFFGFYAVLGAAIEFRQSPWIFWIKDLSVHDPTFVTPILMGLTQFVSQKMTPTSVDPKQARMMLIMPILFTFLFLYFQSGLVLYWLTSNVLQIGQQYVMNRMMKTKKVEMHGKQRRKN
jgi:YidC/Oxa1 family membrane protein insertase